MADTLSFWHPSNDAVLAVGGLNWGTVAPGSSDDQLFRIHNDSTFFAATDITLTVVDVGARSLPVASGCHLLSTDGTYFCAAASIGDLPPLATSAPVTLRRVIPSGMTLGSFAINLSALIAAWT